jgi:hypothetical protein
MTRKSARKIVILTRKNPKIWNELLSQKGGRLKGGGVGGGEGKGGEIKTKEQK